MLSRLWQFTWKTNESDRYIISVQFFWLVFLMFKLLKMVFYLLTQGRWLLNHLLFYCFLTSYLVLVCLSLALWCFWFPHGSIPIHALRSSCLIKQGQIWSTLIFKIGVVKQFDHDQTITNNLRLFNSGTPKHKKYFEIPWRIWT